MEALTLTPAWGGGLQERHPGGESIRQQEGGDLKISSGDSGGGGVGKGSGGGSQNLGGGGGGNSGSSAVPTAYWHRQRKRRTMSSQLVFDTAAPENTEEILQADPSLGGETQWAERASYMRASRSVFVPFRFAIFVKPYYRVIRGENSWLKH